LIFYSFFKQYFEAYIDHKFLPKKSCNNGISLVLETYIGRK